MTYMKSSRQGRELNLQIAKQLTKTVFVTFDFTVSDTPLSLTFHLLFYISDSKLFTTQNVRLTNRQKAVLENVLFE